MYTISQRNIFPGLNCNCWPLSVSLSVGRYIIESIILYYHLLRHSHHHHHHKCYHYLSVFLSVARYLLLTPTSPISSTFIHLFLPTPPSLHLSPLSLQPSKVPEQSHISPGPGAHLHHRSKVGRVLRLQRLPRRHPCKCSSMYSTLS